MTAFTDEKHLGILIINLYFFIKVWKFNTDTVLLSNIGGVFSSVNSYPLYIYIFLIQSIAHKYALRLSVTYVFQSPLGLDINNFGLPL